ncbi:MAG: branched-chain amino acid aminotransferase [Bacteroidetes bacterium]|nr:branched-chain amino acid aminotransferase [Bacteroidota bacterium]
MSLKITTNLVEESRISSFDPDNIVFGRVFTDHMFSCDYVNGQWQNFRIDPFGKIPISPTLSALHYGQSIFEGMKAFKNEEGTITLFRAIDNAKRLNTSADRMCMPALPEEIFMEGLKTLVTIDKDWIPTAKGSALYIRPFMFATDDFLGVKPSDNYKFMIYACPVSAYYSHPLKVRIEDHYTRASKGGVGSAKCAGNYAASMYPTKLAQKAGFDQVLWTDGENHQYLEETGTSNVFIITDDAVYTPELNDSLLAGITRDSIIKLLKSKGKQVVEKKINVEELINWHKQGVLREMFVSGTAATVTNIQLFHYKGENFEVNAKDQLLSTEILSDFRNIRTLQIPDPFGWIEIVSESEVTF